MITLSIQIQKKGEIYTVYIYFLRILYHLCRLESMISAVALNTIEFL